MARPPQDVTDAELAVLQVLWERGPANRRELAEALYPGRGAASYTTVQKLLERLQSKGYVAAHPDAELRSFAAAVTRDELISRRLLDVADKLCEGSVSPLLSSLVRSRPLSAGEVRELRELLDELQGRGRGASKNTRR